MRLQESIKQQNDYCGITHWHEKGYKGQGVTVWNCEKQNDSHGKGTALRVLDAAPECNLVTGSISLTVGVGGKEVTQCGVYDDDGNYHDIHDWITKNNVKVITTPIPFTNVNNKTSAAEKANDILVLIILFFRFSSLDRVLFLFSIGE